MDLSLLNCLRKFLLDSEKLLCGLLDGFVEILSKDVRTFPKRFFREKEREKSRERESRKRESRGRVHVFYIEIPSSKATFTHPTLPPNHKISKESKKSKQKRLLATFSLCICADRLVKDLMSFFTYLFKESFDMRLKSFHS